MNIPAHTSERTERILYGIGVSPGIAMGKIYVVQIEHPRPPHYTLTPENIEPEVERFYKTIEAVRKDFEETRDRISALPDETHDDARILIDTHLAMLSGSRLIRGVENRIRQHAINAEQALDIEMRFMVEEFNKISDAYIKSRIDDINAVCNRLLRHLMHLPFLSLDSVPQGGLVFAQEISPADTVLLDPRKFGGIATMRGGAAGHTAIMARGLGLPAVLGIPDLIEEVRYGDEAIIDGRQNIVIINNSSSSQTITQGASVTIYQVGTANTGNRTLAQRGLCTLLCVASNTYVITGGGVT